jgi:hypothetical protein
MQGPDDAALTVQAERLLKPFHKELLIFFPHHAERWVKGFTELLRRGYSEDTIRQALEQCARGKGKHRHGVGRHQSYGWENWLAEMRNEMQAENTEAA